jgi:hypothetical protein
MKYIILSYLLLTGCALFQEKPLVEKVVYVKTPLSAPPHSELPTLNSKDLQCLSPEVKQKLLDRDRLLHNDRDVYEAIINSTKK